MDSDRFPVEIKEKTEDGWDIDVRWGRRLHNTGPNSWYGCFEVYNEEEDFYQAGGLWYSLQDESEIPVLEDYDGVYDLDKRVVELLRRFKWDLSWYDGDADVDSYN